MTDRLKKSLEMSKSSEKALSLLRHMPRLTLWAVERMPETRKKVIQRACRAAASRRLFLFFIHLVLRGRVP